MIAYVLVTVLVSAMLAWLPLHKRCMARWFDRQARLDGVAAAERRDWALTRQVEDIVTAAEEAYRQYADLVVVAECFCRHAAHEQGLSLLAEAAGQCPTMPQRPAPPTPPGEPWQLQVKNDTLEPRLVERAESDDNPRGETR